MQAPGWPGSAQRHPLVWVFLSLTVDHSPQPLPPPALLWSHRAHVSFPHVSEQWAMAVWPLSEIRTSPDVLLGKLQQCLSHPAQMPPQSKKPLHSTASSSPGPGSPWSSAELWYEVCFMGLECSLGSGWARAGAVFNLPFLPCQGSQQAHTYSSQAEPRLPTSLLLVPEQLQSAKGASLPYTILYTKWSKRVVYVLLNEKSLMRELKILNRMLGIQKISETFWKIDYFHGRYTHSYIFWVICLL